MNGLIGGTLGVRLLTAVNSTGQLTSMPDGVPPAYQNTSKLELLFGQQIWDEIRDKVVVDFGCGEGHQVIELAERGARCVVGLETNWGWIASATERVATAGLAGRCVISERWRPQDPPPDVIISLDSFEHYQDPAGVLQEMHRILTPGGIVRAAFGPPWFHPYGGHLFSVFPWAHLLFSEHAMVTWRSGLPGKGPATSLLDAGINRMSVERFERLVATSPFQFRWFDAVPIWRRRWPAWSREFTTSIVRCTLETRR